MNGKPCVPVLNDQLLPKYLQSRRLENVVNKNSNNRIKIFSGTANFALSQVNPRSLLFVSGFWCFIISFIMEMLVFVL